MVPQEQSAASTSRTPAITEPQWGRFRRQDGVSGSLLLLGALLVLIFGLCRDGYCQWPARLAHELTRRAIGLHGDHHLGVHRGHSMPSLSTPEMAKHARLTIKSTSWRSLGVLSWPRNGNLR